MRHDLVALVALVATVAVGLVPAEKAFRGFARPAVVTVAAVLILGAGLESSGAIDRFGRLVLPETAGPVRVLAMLYALAALFSAFMNNVGALALSMPMMATGLVPPRTVYQAVDRPVVVLLGAMAPLGQAMATTGTADLLARWLLDVVTGAPVWAILAVLFLATMTVSDFVNNAAT